MYYIGVDLGTSSVKILLVDEAGTVCKSVSQTYPLEFPQPGWSQQNPEDWWNAVRTLIPQLLEGIDPAQVKGLAAGGQMHGLVALDKDDTVIRPAIRPARAKASRHHSSGSSYRLAKCSLGSTRACPLVAGPRSRITRNRSSSYSVLDGISPLAILQKIQSSFFMLSFPLAPARSNTRGAFPISG